MISQLIQKIQKTKAPICVGLDPMLGYIPNHIVQRAFKDFGETMEGAAEAVWQFNKEIIDNTYDLIPHASGRSHCRCILPLSSGPGCSFLKF